MALFVNMVLRNTTKMDGFSAAEASRLAGFEKPWMLNHLERERIFVPEKTRDRRQGKHRKYTFRDVVVLRAINRLLKLGARPKRIRDSIDTFERVFPEAKGADALLAFARLSCFFVVTQTQVLFCQTPYELLDLAKKGQLAFSFMLDSSQEIGPAVEAGLFYLEEVRNGKLRGPKLLERTARRFHL